MPKNKITEHAVYALKGFTIGSLMTVPGVSGGTLAIILGIYDKLLSAVATLFSDFKKNIIFLFTVAISLLLGMVTLSRLILLALELTPVPVSFFFIGAIAGSVPMLFKKTGLKKFSISCFICAAVGIACVFLLDLIPDGILEINGGFQISQIPAFIVCGIALAIAVIVPGVSFSHILMIFGIYERFYQALSSLDFIFLLSVGVPTAIALLALIRLFDFLLKKYPSQSYSAILGFVVASVKDIYVGLPSDVVMIIASVAALAVGLVAVLIVTGIFSKKQVVK
ncbi:MAG: DUF368 domain-containing protein [Clostridia bacterium]|nr:DUF368 domain-containing protein [Clostridia bacterium]